MFTNPAFICQKYIKYNCKFIIKYEILLQFKIADFYFNLTLNIIYSSDGKAEF